MIEAHRLVLWVFHVDRLRLRWRGREVELLILAAAAFVGGALNALAGGGTFVTFPALVFFASLSPIAANATSAVVALPGYLGSVAGSHRDLEPVHGLGVRMLAVTAAAGGAVGAGLLLLTPAPLFRGLIPWLLLLATALFAFAPRLVPPRKTEAPPGKMAVLGPLFAISVYGGYFNGGLGILLLAVFGLLGLSKLNTMNALKNLMSAVLASFSVTMFAVAGLVAWREAAVMAIASLVGGYAGARVTRTLSKKVLRPVVIGIGLIMTVLFFNR